MVAVAEETITPWTTPDAVKALKGHGTGADDATLTWVIGLASRKLWHATGRRYGVVTQQVQPVRLLLSREALRAGYRRGVPISSIPRRDGDHNARCSCVIDALALPGPIQAVDRFMLNGVAQPLDVVQPSPDRRWLWRMDGSSWPCSQDVKVRPDEVRANPETDAWSITYSYGRPVPVDGAAVAAQLAEHFVKMLPTGGCSMPAGLVRLQRQGVTLSFDTDDKPGKTGVEIVDEWLNVFDHRRRRKHARAVRLTSASDKLEWRYPIVTDVV